MILDLWRRLGLVRDNFRGAPLPTGVGVLIGMAAMGLSRSLEGVIVAGAALMGLVDDRAKETRIKGFRGHLMALLNARLTTGTAKALYGLGAGIVAGWVLYQQGSAVGAAGRTWWLAVVDALVLALAMNAFNLLDLRPGRALKVWFPLAAGLWVAAYAQAPEPLRSELLQPMLIAGAVVALILFPLDLREKLMLGDSGTMALGALVGWSIIATMGAWVRILALVVLAALHVATERISLSSVIATVPPLRWLDRLGRPPEESVEEPPVDEPSFEETPVEEPPSETPR